jgi:phosphatidylglycerophosphate synthase
MVTVGAQTAPETAAEYGPVVGMAVQLLLLATLGVEVGLGPLGWLTGTAYALVVCVLLTRGLHRAGMAAMGPANQVTLARATLVGAVAALVADSAAHPVPVAVVTALAGVAVLLDGVDGKVARRTGSITAVGARFDMEVDAFLLLVLSGYLARPLGAWVLGIGLLRYAFVAAAWLLPWLRAPLPPRLSRKVVAATQGIVLVVATAGLAPRPFALAGVGAALGVLCWSFGRDVGLLWRARPAWFPVAARLAEG